VLALAQPCADPVGHIRWDLDPLHHIAEQVGQDLLTNVRVTAAALGVDFVW
jgi:hypothetical protein